MNKSYMYTKDNIIVYDEKNNERNLELRDNVKELLLLENLIEMIDIVLENEWYELEKIEDEERINFYFKNFIMCPSFLSIPYLVNIITNSHSKIMIDTMFGKQPLEFLEAIGCYILSLILLNLNDYKTKKKNKLEINGHSKIYKELKDYSLYQQIILETLKLQDEYTKVEEQYRKFEIDIEEQQRELQYLINASMYYGKFKKKLINIYDDGLIDEVETLLPKEKELIKKFIKEDRK